MLCSLSPLLSILLSSSSPPTTLILPKFSPDSLPLARELLYTGQCKGTLEQLEDAVHLLGLLGIQIRNEVDGRFEVGEQTKEASFILGGCEPTTDYTIEEIVDESLSDVRDSPHETKIEEQFASIIVGDQTCLDALNLSNIQMEVVPSFRIATIKEAHEHEKSVLPNDKQSQDNNEGMEFVEILENEKRSFKEDSLKVIGESSFKKLVDLDILLSDDDLNEISNVNHEQDVEISSSDVSKIKSFPCDQCEYVASQNGHLKRHVTAKHGVERFECKLCGKKFTLKESLRRHVKEVHGNHIFPCPECDFVGKRQDSLNYHLQWKHSDEKSTCDECGYEADTVRLIQRHKLRVHRGIKYSCDKCDYVTADKSSLYYHMKSKHEKIRFQCDVCTRKFTKSTSLKIHMKTVHKKT